MIKKKGIDKKGIGKKPSNPKKSENPTLTLIGYEVTSEVLRIPGISRLPDYAEKKMEQVYFKSQRHPEKVIPELLALLEEFPDHPQLLNLLGAAYFHSGKREEAEKIILKNYQLHPKYIFACLNYGDLCLLREEPEKIPEIFNSKYDIGMFMPQRKVFHISEVVGFMALMGNYFFALGEKERAEMYLQHLEEIAPKHPKTKELHHKIVAYLIENLPEGSFLKRFFSRKNSSRLKKKE